jgi:hypothetical protein
VNARLRGLDRIVLVVDGRRGAGKIEDLIDFKVQGEGDVVAYQLEVLPVE